MQCPECGCRRDDHNRVMDYDWYDQRTEIQVTNGSMVTCRDCGECYTEYEPNYEIVNDYCPWCYVKGCTGKCGLQD